MAVLTPTGFPTSAKTLSGDCTSVYSLAIATTDLDSTSDFLKLAIVPAGYRLVGLTLACNEDPDSNASPTLAGDIGLLDAGGTALVTDTTVAVLTTTNSGTDTGFYIGIGSGSMATDLPNVKNTSASDMYIALDFTGAAATADACTFVVSATITPI